MGPKMEDHVPNFLFPAPTPTPLGLLVNKNILDRVSSTSWPGKCPDIYMISFIL